MKYTRRAFLATCTAMAFGLVHAADQEESLPPPDAYRRKIEGDVFICSMTMRLVILRGNNEDQEKYSQCVKAARTDGKRYFEAALKMTRKSKAKEALKSYHVAFLAALDATGPRAGDTEYTYEARRNGMNDKLAEAWARFEVER